MMKAATIAFATCLVAACAPQSTPPDPRINAIADRLDIEDAVTELFVAVDEKAWERARAAFAPQVDFDMTSLAGGEPAVLSPQAIVDGWAAGLDSVAAIHHQIGNLRVVLDGDKAIVQCYGTATHFRPDEAKRVTVFVGTYDFHLLNADGAWKIDRMRYTSKYVE